MVLELGLALEPVGMGSGAEVEAGIEVGGAVEVDMTGGEAGEGEAAAAVVVVVVDGEEDMEEAGKAGRKADLPITLWTLTLDGGRV